MRDENCRRAAPTPADEDGATEPRGESVLAEIWAFVGQDDPGRADAFVQAVEGRFGPLLTSPDIGAPRDGLAPVLRALVHGRYVIYYTARPPDLVIVRVLHGARDAAAIFSG